MKYIVTGANGMLGVALLPVLRSITDEILATDILCDGKGLKILDVTDEKAVLNMISKERPEAVFHLAAETDVDKCESNPDRTYLVNTLGTENIAIACSQYDACMVYISTLSVFDGKKSSPYTEFDQPNPLSIYSKSKWEGEKIVSRLMKKYFIFRCGWLLGGGKKDKKFVAKIVELLNTKDEIPVVNDKFGNPSFTGDVSEGIITVMKTGRFGLYHLTNKGYCSRYDIACKMRDFLGKAKVNIKAISSRDFPLPAPRPDREVGENYKLKLLGMEDLMRPWEEALKEYLTRQYL